MFSFIFVGVQERDAERRRQLRERARQLIAEARSGVKMSEMSLLDASSTDRGKGSKASPTGGQHIPKYTHTQLVYPKRHALYGYIAPINTHTL